MLNPSEIILTLAARSYDQLTDDVCDPGSAVSRTLGPAMREMAMRERGAGAFAAGVLWEKAMAAAPGLLEQAQALGLEPGVDNDPNHHAHPTHW